MINVEDWTDTHEINKLNAVATIYLRYDMKCLSVPRLF